MNKELLTDGLNQVISYAGIENMQNGKKILALFSDLVPNGLTERNALKHVYQSGAMELIITSTESSAKMENAVLQAVDILHNHAFMDKQVAKMIIGAIIDAVCPELKPINSLMEQVPEAKSEPKKQKEPAAAPVAAAHPKQPKQPAYKPAFVVVDNNGKPVDMRQYAMPVSDSVVKQAQQARETAASSVANEDPNISKNLEFTELEDGTYSVKAKLTGKGGMKLYTGSSSIVIPARYNGKAVTEIPSYAFDRCRNLNSLHIPYTIRKIESGAFATQKMSALHLDPENRFFRMEGNCLIENQTERMICGDETSRIPATVKIIGKSAFYRNLALQTVDLPNGVTTVEDYAFYNSTLHSINLPNSLKYIGKRAFEDCRSLVSAKLPDSVVEIGEAAFLCSGCDNQPTDMALPKNLERLGSVAFHYHGWKEIVIPQTLKKIEGGGFPESCIKKLKISSRHPYYKQENDCLLEKGTGRLICCADSATIEIPEGVKVIASTAFRALIEKQSVFIPQSVEKIEEGAFANQCNFEISYAGTPDQWEKLSEGNHTLSQATVTYVKAASKEDVEMFDFELSEEREYDVNTGRTHISDVYIIRRKNGVTYPSKLVIPSAYNGKKVKTIGAGAFQDCTELKEVEISEGIEVIGESAFKGCGNLESVTIPKSVNILPTMVFYKCKKLYYIKLHENVTKIGPGAFAECESLVHITIWRDVTAIDHYAFAGCKKLKEITYVGSKESWKKIHKAKMKLLWNKYRFPYVQLIHSWKSGSGKFVVRCFDGNISKSRA